MFDSLYELALNEKITPDIALRLLEESNEPVKALKLFQAATEIRDKITGKELWWSGGIGAITPCMLEPKCSYCKAFTSEVMPIERLLQAVKKIEGLGIKHVHLSGGTSLKGYDEEIINMVAAVKKVSDIHIEVNLGPSFSEATIKELKKLGVKSITSSLETTNEEIFKKAKPGDSLEERKNLIRKCEKLNMPVRSMMLIGLGESNEDRVKHLFYLKEIKNLYQIRFSRFHPYAETLYDNHPRCSPLELAKTVALARLIMPSVELGLANGNTTDDIPLWYLSGGGNQLLGAMASVKHDIDGLHSTTLRNNMETISRFMKGMNRKVSFEYPKTNE